MGLFSGLTIAGKFAVGANGEYLWSRETPKQHTITGTKKLKRAEASAASKMVGTIMVFDSAFQHSQAEMIVVTAGTPSTKYLYRYGPSVVICASIVAGKASPLMDRYYPHRLRRSSVVARNQNWRPTSVRVSINLLT